MAITTITSQPSNSIHTANRPMVYEVLVFGAETQHNPALDIQININGLAFREKIPVEPYDFNNAIGSGATSKFRFSVSEIVQEHFNKNSILPAIATPGPVINDNFQAQVSLVISTLYPDADGILQTEAGAITSPAVRVINTRSDPEEAQEDVTRFYLVSGIPNFVGSVQPLSSKPLVSTISLDDSEFLAYYNTSISHGEITTFDAGGNQLETGQFSMAPNPARDHAAIIGVGPANINNGLVLISGSVTIDETVDNYIVKFGATGLGLFFTFSEIHRYYIVPSSCRKHRVHFQGSQGHIESFSIFNSEKVSNRVKSDTYQQGRPVYAGVIDRGSNRFASRGTLEIKSPIGDLTSQEQKWLATSFANSTRIWIEKQGKYIPVYLKDGSFPIADSDKPINELKFTLAYSNDYISQRN